MTKARSKRLQRAQGLCTYRIFQHGRLIDVLRSSEKYPLALVEIVESEARGFPVTAKRG